MGCPGVTGVSSCPCANGKLTQRDFCRRAGPRYLYSRTLTLNLARGRDHGDTRQLVERRGTSGQRRRPSRRPFATGDLSPVWQRHEGHGSEDGLVGRAGTHTPFHQQPVLVHGKQRADGTQTRASGGIHRRDAKRRRGSRQGEQEGHGGSAPTLRAAAGREWRSQGAAEARDRGLRRAVRRPGARAGGISEAAPDVEPV